MLHKKTCHDFYKSEVLAQTNKKIYEDMKVQKKNPGHVILNFILSFNIAVEKENLFKLELTKEIFLSPEYPNFLA